MSSFGAPWHSVSTVRRSSISSVRARARSAGGCSRRPAGEGGGEMGGVLQPARGGLWGMPREMLRTLPGYDPDIARNRQEARGIMERLGYGANNRLKIKLTTRDIPPFRNPAVILLDHLKE